MNKFEQLHTIYKLKEINRYGEKASGHPESTSDHVYSSFVLVEYFLKLIKESLDKEKVIKLTLYHDMIEIYAEDTFILDTERVKTKKEREQKAFEKIM